MIELYYLKEPDSICSNRVLVTLHEKNIRDWVAHPVVLMRRDQFSPDYIALNPKAQVPTLVHDGRPIRESSIICDYIDDIRPAPALKPDDPVRRAEMREWIKDSDESGYQATATLNFVTKFRLTVPVELMEKRWESVRDIERLHRQQSCIREGMESPYVYRAIGIWERTFDRVERTLSDGRPWLMGEQLTLAEIAYAPFIKVLEMIEFLDLFIERRPQAARWCKALAARDSVLALDEFGYTGPEGIHGKSGRQCRQRASELLHDYRDWFSRASAQAGPVG